LSGVTRDPEATWPPAEGRIFRSIVLFFVLCPLTGNFPPELVTPRMLCLLLAGFDVTIGDSFDLASRSAINCTYSGRLAGDLNPEASSGTE
jgi:hypothetical protein